MIANLKFKRQHIPRYLLFHNFSGYVFMLYFFFFFFTNGCKSLSLAFITWLLFMKFHNGGLIST